MLSKLGYENVTHAESGKDAWDKMQEQDFDFILTDWNMPEMTGLELLIEIRKHEKYKNLPVVLITAEAEKENIVAAIHKGANGYILKPFNQEKLKAALDKNLK